MTLTAAPDVEARRDALADRLFLAGLGAFDLLTVALGDRLGLYRSLASDGPATARELATLAGIAPRYAREWLVQLDVGGIPVVGGVGASPGAAASRIPVGPWQRPSA